MRTIFNTFFTAIYRANKHRGDEKAIFDAALVTSGWLALLMTPLTFIGLDGARAFFGSRLHLSELGFVVLSLTAFCFLYFGVRRLGDTPLSQPRLALDTFLKQRVFAIGCISLPFVLALIAREVREAIGLGAI